MTPGQIFIQGYTQVIESCIVASSADIVDTNSDRASRLYKARTHKWKKSWFRTVKSKELWL